MNHPTPWRVVYWRWSHELQKHVCPYIVDANDHTVADIPMIDHSKEGYEAADKTAKQIVSAVNFADVQGSRFG